MTTRLDLARATFRRMLPDISKSMSDADVNEKINTLSGMTIEKGTRYILNSITDTKQPHFIPKFYLEAWGKKRIFYYSKHRSTYGKQRPGDVLKSNRLYRLEPLRPSEVTFISNFIDANTNERTRKLNHGWMRNFHEIFILLESITPPTEYAGTFEEYKRLLRDNQIERLLGTYESRIAPTIIWLLCINKDTSYKSLTQLQDLIMYMALQIFRTRKFKDSFSTFEEAAERHQISTNTIWPYMIPILATDVAIMLISEMSTYSTTLIKTSKEVPFFTNDSPVLNIGTGTLSSNDTMDMRLFLPISATTAILYEKEGTGRENISIRTARNNEVYALNKLVFDNAYDMLVGHDAHLLEKFVLQSSA